MDITIDKVQKDIPNISTKDFNEAISSLTSINLSSEERIARLNDIENHEQDIANQKSNDSN